MLGSDECHCSRLEFKRAAPALGASRAQQSEVRNPSGLAVRSENASDGIATRSALEKVCFKQGWESGDRLPARSLDDRSRDASESIEFPEPGQQAV